MRMKKISLYKSKAMIWNQTDQDKSVFCIKAIKHFSFTPLAFLFVLWKGQNCCSAPEANRGGILQLVQRPLVHLSAQKCAVLPKSSGICPSARPAEPLLLLPPPLPRPKSPLSWGYFNHSPGLGVGYSLPRDGQPKWGGTAVRGEDGGTGRVSCAFLHCEIPGVETQPWHSRAKLSSLPRVPCPADKVMFIYGSSCEFVGVPWCL